MSHNSTTVSDQTILNARRGKLRDSIITVSLTVLGDLGIGLV